MPNYRRVFIPGGCWFFTVNLLDRRQQLLVEHIVELREAVRWTRNRWPFEIDAWVVLPDHLHAVWSPPPGDADFPMRRRHIKMRFSKSLPNVEAMTASRRSRGERGIWQRRYSEHSIRDEHDYHAHLAYCWWLLTRRGPLIRRWRPLARSSGLRGWHRAGSGRRVGRLRQWSGCRRSSRRPRPSGSRRSLCGYVEHHITATMRSVRLCGVRSRAVTKCFSLSTA